MATDPRNKSQSEHKTVSKYYLVSWRSVSSSRGLFLWHQIMNREQVNFELCSFGLFPESCLRMACHGTFAQHCPQVLVKTVMFMLNICHHEYTYEYTYLSKTASQSSSRFQFLACNKELLFCLR